MKKEPKGPSSAQIRYVVYAYARSGKAFESSSVAVPKQDRAVATGCVVAGLLDWERPGIARVSLTELGRRLVEEVHALEPAVLAKRVKLTAGQLTWLRKAVQKRYASADRVAYRAMCTLVDLQLAKWTRGLSAFDVAIEPTDRGRAYLAELDAFTELFA